MVAALRIRGLGLVVGLLCTAIACGTGSDYAVPPGNGTPTLTSAADVFVGERASLTAVFYGGDATIDGIGPVRSGVPVQTAPLARTTIFTLRVAGTGGEVQAEATVHANYRNRIRVLAAAPIAQTNHVAVALPDGRALAMGGNTSATVLVPDSTVTQIFDPGTERFSEGPDLTFAVQGTPFTSVAPLLSGEFLLVGTGQNAPGGPLHPVITQLFDPARPGFTRVGNTVTQATTARTATALADGGALVTGGLTGTSDPVSDAADRYDSASVQWRTAAQMLHARVVHTGTLLRDGRVLVAGGLSCCRVEDRSPEFFTETVELYDPASDRFAAAGSLTTARGNHAAAVLQDGRVLITGGNGNDPIAFVPGTEIFDPGSGQFTSAGNLQFPRDSHSAVTLTDGRVLVIGGEAPAQQPGVAVAATEIYDPATGRWSAGPVLDPAFFAATVTMLANGKILIFGGQDAGGFPQSAVALFE
jgi:hypothetical protein